MYRLLVTLLEPFTFLYLLAVLGVILLWRQRAGSRRRLLCLTIPLALLGILSLPVVGYLAMGSLEWRYAMGSDRPEDAEAVVVLSGYVRAPDNQVPQADIGMDTTLRCLHAARLYRQGKPCLIVASGGKVDPAAPGPTLAGVMRDFLRAEGVRGEDLLTEDQSSTTYENARDTSALLSERGLRRIVLVTSASHMPRAQLCFRAQGLEVTPSACDFQARWTSWGPSNLLPSLGALGQVQHAAHEWLGIAWYWLWGRV